MNELGAWYGSHISVSLRVRAGGRELGAGRVSVDRLHRQRRLVRLSMLAVISDRTISSVLWSQARLIFLDGRRLQSLRAFSCRL